VTAEVLTASVAAGDTQPSNAGYTLAFAVAAVAAAGGGLVAAFAPAAAAPSVGRGLQAPIAGGSAPR
jgi:hypothetical protein